MPPDPERLSAWNGSILRNDLAVRRRRQGAATFGYGTLGLLVLVDGARYFTASRHVIYPERNDGEPAMPGIELWAGDGSWRFCPDLEIGYPPGAKPAPLARADLAFLKVMGGRAQNGVTGGFRVSPYLASPLSGATLIFRGVRDSARRGAVYEGPYSRDRHGSILNENALRPFDSTALGVVGFRWAGSWQRFAGNSGVTLWAESLEGVRACVGHVVGVTDTGTYGVVTLYQRSFEQMDVESFGVIEGATNE